MGFSWDSRFLISGDGEGKLFVWDWKSTKVRAARSRGGLCCMHAVLRPPLGCLLCRRIHYSATPPPPPSIDPQIVRSMKAHDQVVMGCAWHPHETSKVATCSWDGLIKYWD